MGLDDVVADVMARAESEAEAIRQEGKAEADKILAKARQSAAELREQSRNDLGRQIANLRQREISAQTLENKKRLLRMQRDLLGEVYGQAEARLSALPAKERGELIKTCFEKAINRLDAKFVYCRAEDKLIAQKLDPGMEVSATLGTVGGIIIEDAYHERMDNYTFEAVMERVKDSTLHQVSLFLFGGGK